MTTSNTALEQLGGPDFADDYFGDDPVKPEFEPIGVTPRYKPARAEINPDKTKNWFWRIFPVLYTHKLLVFLTLSMSLTAMVINISIPALIGRIIDFGLVARSKPLLSYVILLTGLGVGHGILVFGSRYTHALLTYNLDYDLRTLIYGHLTKLSFSFFDRIQTGQLISRANSDIQAVERFLVRAPDMFQTCMTFILALTYMMSLHVKLTLVAMLTLPAVYFLSSRMRRIMFPLSWLNQSRVADVTTVADENINGVRVVKSFTAEKRQIKELADAAERLRWSRVETVKLRAQFMPLIGTLPQFGTAMILLYGGYLVIHGEITVGTLVAFNTYVMMISAPFRTFAMFLIQYERARASAKRIYEILDEKSEIVEPPDALDLVKPKGEVEFRNVSFAYHQGPAVLKNFDMKIKPGEAVAIVGRTGCGKSTVTRLLARFYEVSEGSICIDGKDIRDLSVVSLRAAIGMVLDEPFLFSTPVRDNISYGRPDATLDEIIRSAKSASAHEFIGNLPEGYDSIIGERGYTLSGGQRQRIAIARTLLVNPRILVLDDATSSVDVQVEAEIHDALRTLMQDRTTIVIAHRLSTILLADRVVLVEGGNIIASGTHSELMANEPRYVEVLARAEAEIDLDAEKDETQLSEVLSKLETVKMESRDDLIPDEGDGYDDGDNYGGGS